MFFNALKSTVGKLGSSPLPSHIKSILSVGVQFTKITDCKNNHLLHKSAHMDACKNVSFEELRLLLKDQKNVVIDVREKQELVESGEIEGSRHIPLGEISRALTMDANAFKNKYGFEKPEPDTKLIFSCRSGKRSLNACEIANKIGYSNLWNYSGGFLDWSEKTKND